MDPYLESVLIVTFCYMLITLGLWVTLDSGQFSVAHAMLSGVGGYAGGIASVQLQLSFLPAIALGALAGAVAGCVMALILIRTSGMLLGTVTIAIGQAVALSIQNIPALGGSQGYAGIPLATTLPVVIAAVAVALILVLAVRRTRFGMGVHAVGLDETVSSSLGLSVLSCRLYGYGMGGALAGTGGVLLAHYNGLVEPSSMSFAAAPLFFIFLMVGGVTSPWGAIVGTAAMWWLQELLRFRWLGGQWWVFSQADRYWIIGLVLVISVLVRPKGLIVRRPTRRTRRRTTTPSAPAPTSDLIGEPA